MAGPKQVHKAFQALFERPYCQRYFNDRHQEKDFSKIPWSWKTPLIWADMFTWNNLQTNSLDILTWNFKFSLNVNSRWSFHKTWRQMPQWTWKPENIQIRRGFPNGFSLIFNLDLRQLHFQHSGSQFIVISIFQRNKFTTCTVNPPLYDYSWVVVNALTNIPTFLT